MELHREGSAPTACAAGLFDRKLKYKNESWERASKEKGGKPTFFIFTSLGLLGTSFLARRLGLSKSLSDSRSLGFCSTLGCLVDTGLGLATGSGKSRARSWREDWHQEYTGVSKNEENLQISK